MDELLQQQKMNAPEPVSSRNTALKFAFRLILWFAFFYGFNLFYNGLMAPGGNYNAFLAQHFNYIQALRNFLLRASSTGLSWMGYSTKTNNFELLAVGHNKISLAYDCLGLGVMSFLTAFAISFPARLKSKLTLLLGCVIGFQLLNILRFMVLALYWKSGAINHHTVFNLLIYALVTVTLYLFIEKSTVKEAS